MKLSRTLFPIGGSDGRPQRAGLDTCDTADWEGCATGPGSRGALSRWLRWVWRHLLAASCVMSATIESAEPPNIILVMADDQGWGDMAYNGHPDVKTPHFDDMARTGVRFERFYAAAPVCSPTRGSVLTGRAPNRYGAYTWGYPIRPQELTLAQAIKPAGYRTGHFGKWHVGSVQRGSPVNPGACGFDEWVSSPNYYDMDPILSDQGRAVPFKGESSEITVDVAIQFIRKCAAQNQRFLAVVWFGSPHAPHQALEKDLALYAGLPMARQNFLAEITAMDRAVGRLRDELRALGLRDHTLLWYCSDNGALPKVGSSGGRRGHKGSIYEGGLLVPALLEWPARLQAPHVITSAAVTSDIYPTVLDIAGVKPARQPVLDGISLWPVINGGADVREAPIGFWVYPAPGIRTPAKQWMEELYAAQQAGREPDNPARLFADAGKLTRTFPLDSFPGHAAWLDRGWKLHRIQPQQGGEVQWELYHLATDDRERDDLAGKQPERAAAMRAQLEAWLRSVARSHNGEDYPHRAASGAGGSQYQPVGVRPGAAMGY